MFPTGKTITVARKNAIDSFFYAFDEASRFMQLLLDGVKPGEYGRREAFRVHQTLKAKGPVRVPREFVFMDRAAIGLGAVFLHLDARLNFYRLFNEAIEIPVDSGPHNIAIGGGWVWVTNRDSETLQKIDPSTNSIVATIEGVAGSPAVGVVATDEVVWVAYPGGVVGIILTLLALRFGFRINPEQEAEAYRAGVESLGTEGYTVMQLMQIVGERNVRIVPDVAVSGNSGSTGLVDGLLGMMLRSQSNGHGQTKQN
jgi:YVTN family beta-propeller protein